MKVVGHEEHGIRRDEHSPVRLEESEGACDTRVRKGLEHAGPSRNGSFEGVLEQSLR